MKTSLVHIFWGKTLVLLYSDILKNPFLGEFFLEFVADSVARSRQAFTATSDPIHGHFGTFHGHIQ
jgi:hypothetical protein